MLKKIFFFIFVLAIITLYLISNQSEAQSQTSTVDIYKPSWPSLKQHKTPRWLQDGKFGIYTHWGIYAVHAYGENTTWYSFAMYMDPDGEARKHFEKTFGKLTP